MSGSGCRPCRWCAFIRTQGWLLIVVIVFGAAASAFAGANGLSDAAGLSDKAIEKRIGFIEKRLDAHKLHGQIWYWSWMSINAGSAVGLSFAALNTGDKANRVNYASQATLGAIGVADLLFRPLKARHGADPIRDMPEATRQEKQAKLEAAEKLLRANAERASERHYWVMHVGNVVANSAAGAATAIAGDASGGAISAGIGIVMGEIFLFSQPAGPEKDWEAYQQMISGRSQSRLRFSVRPAGMGLAVEVRW